MARINGRGTFLCYKYAAEQMIKQGRGGCIIGASSITGKQGGNCHKVMLLVLLTYSKASRMSEHTARQSGWSADSRRALV